MKQDINQYFGTLNGIVNNAGWVQFKSFFKYDPYEWKREIEICYYGILHLAYTFLPEMIEKNNGKFINIIGDSARTGDKNLIISSSARAGMISFLKSLTHEVGKYNIQCNSVALGMINQDSSNFDEVMLQKIIRQYPSKRFGFHDDVCGIVLFLLPKWSGWITGQVISVNSGYSMIG